MGYAHATIHHNMLALRDRAAGEQGQGTVEYIGLLLLIGGLIGAVAAAKVDGGKVATTIADRLKQAISDVKVTR
ncbi:MAG: hypothetical protein HZB46_11545 [Solirubrobacterales bacterium]|nr:hypothetical protein [Solirubrobacterales bacterium]